MEIHNEILIYGFVMAVVMGAVVNKTNFCTMGAVSDMVNMGDTGRFRSWLFAIAVSIAGVIILESSGAIDLDSMENAYLRPPYRMANFDWLRFILGGFMFGIGMTLASGCANKTLIRVGGGNLKSVLVLFIASYFAYLMAKTDFYGTVFYSWMNPLAIDLSAHGIQGQDVGRLIAGATEAEEDGAAINIRAILGGIFVIAMLAYIFKSADFRKSLDNILGGLVVGLCVIGAWWLTGGSKGQEWIENVTFMDSPPRGVGAQSFTFTSPMADTFDYGLNMIKTATRQSGGIISEANAASADDGMSDNAMDDSAGSMEESGSMENESAAMEDSGSMENESASMDDADSMGMDDGFGADGMEESGAGSGESSPTIKALKATNRTFATFGVMLLAGAILGSFLYAVIFRKFRIEWFQSWKDFAAHSIGAVLMGIGGVLALGCTIGQGVTGFSNLAIGSIMTFIFIIFGSALTMKIQYYKMVYESEASFFGALITALVDMKLLPGGMRKLEAV